MLEDMHAKGVAEKEAEAAAHTEFTQFCKDTAWDKSTSIKTGKASIEELTADIGKAGADILVATKEIAALDADLTQWEKDVKRETDIRDSAHKVYATTHEDLTEAIDAVERALAKLKGGAASASLYQTSLLQLSSMGRLSAKDKTKIMSFLKQPRNALLQDAMEIEQGSEQPQAKEVAYESSSGGVIDMVEKLGEKFEKEREELETQESEDKFNFDMMIQDLSSSIDKATEEREGKVSLKAQTEGSKADDEGELSDTKATLAEDEKLLSDLTAECEAKTMEFENNQKVRQEELDAITKAIEIMKSDAVSLVQTSAGMTSLVQLRSTAGSSDRMNAAQQAVVIFLEDKAQRMNSRILQLLAVKAASDPFKKIIKMIKDMITKLVEEANEEAEHKGFCDKEMGQNKATRDAKTEEVELLKAKTEELGADIAKLAQQITELSEAVVAIDSAVKEATDMRMSEKEKNTATIADAKAGKEAVGKALKVLRDFYDKAATATMLVQVQATGKAPYKGMSGGGVLGMLEVCESDFARLESETTSGEATAVQEYDQFMADSSADKETKEKDGKDKKATQQSKEYELSGAKKDMAGVQDELDAAMAYYEKLKPSCVDAGETYEERVARRKEEIESLKEALKILNGESV